MIQSSFHETLHFPFVLDPIYYYGLFEVLFWLNLEYELIDLGLIMHQGSLLLSAITTAKLLPWFGPHPHYSYESVELGYISGSRMALCLFKYKIYLFMMSLDIITCYGGK